VAYDTWLYATRHWTRWKRWKVKAKVMLYVTRNFVVDRTAGSLELMRQDGVTGVRAWAKLLAYLWVRPGMFRKIAGAWFTFFLPGFHPWNADDRALLRAYDQSAADAPQPKRKVRRAA
jgi:predicted metal-dependent hydrolase